MTLASTRIVGEGRGDDGLRQLEDLKKRRGCEQYLELAQLYEIVMYREILCHPTRDLKIAEIPNCHVEGVDSFRDKAARSIAASESVSIRLQ